MPLFSSQRERRLWLWTLLVVAAIYSTLGLASRWAATLGQYDFFGVGLFVLGCFLVLVTVITQGLDELIQLFIPSRVLDPVDIFLTPWRRVRPLPPQ